MAIYNGFTHWKLWFSIVMLIYQRVNWLYWRMLINPMIGVWMPFCVGIPLWDGCQGCLLLVNHIAGSIPMTEIPFPMIVICVILKPLPILYHSISHSFCWFNPIHHVSWPCFFCSWSDMKNPSVQVGQEAPWAPFQGEQWGRRSMPK